MNNPSPLVPQGSTIDPKNKGRARVKLAVFFVLAVHGVGLLALLLQGCRKEEPASQVAQTTNSLPVFEAPTNTLADVAPPAATNQQPLTAESPTNSAPSSGGGDYVVARGDTFATIAKKFSVSTKAMMDANAGIEPTKLRVGQKLHVPVPAKASPAVAGTAAPGAAPEAGQPYTVKSGDTLIKIASEHHTSVRALRTANNLHTDSIRVGQRLKIPSRLTASTSVPSEASSSPPTIAATTSR
jgi:LysM repeat protein